MCIHGVIKKLLKFYYLKKQSVYHQGKIIIVQLVNLGIFIILSLVISTLMETIIMGSLGMEILKIRQLLSQFNISKRKILRLKKHYVAIIIQLYYLNLDKYLLLDMEVEVKILLQICLNQKQVNLDMAINNHFLNLRELNFSRI